MVATDEQKGEDTGEEADSEPPPVPENLARVSRDGKETHYNVIKKIGSGGFAVVYLVENSETGEQFALKCTSKARFTNQRIKKKLVSEIEIHHSLHHRHIVEFKGVFQDSNYVYFVLEYCSKGNVLESLRLHPPFNEKRTANIARQVLEALVYLHKKKIVHRDLKLQNFLIDSDDVIKLADFGLSLNLEKMPPKPSICGTPGYISPEVVTGNPDHTPAIDIWALGVCVFLMLTGKQPFKSTDRKETYKKIKHVTYAWPATPVVSDTAKSFVDSVLKRNPEQRPSAQLLLHHPFILQLHPPPVEQTPTIPRSVSMQYTPKIQPDLATTSQSEEQPDLPNYTVKIWWDFSKKYGLAYLLNNGVCGACFNDASRIVLSPDETFAQYWASPHAPNMEICNMAEIESHPLRKKLLLIVHFCKELKKRIDQSRSPSETSFALAPPENPFGHVKYWARTDNGILFRMANKDIQANFKDHTKIVIEAGSKKMFYDSNGKISQLHLSVISDRDNYHDVRKRFAMVKEMSKHLI